MSAAGGAVAAAAAIANAIKASGVLVNVKPEEFMAILRRTERPLIITSEGGIFSTSYKYLTSYKGIAFYTKARVPLVLPAGAEIVRAQDISIPQL
jgi:hypothetical protein